jgi:hypothetical protein
MSNANRIPAEATRDRPDSGRLRKVTVALVLAGGLVLLLAMASAGVSWFACPFHELTGRSCLTCGMTRSLAAVGRGDFASAFQYHLFGPILAAGIALWSLGMLGEGLAGRKILQPIVRSGVRGGMILFGLLWLLYGLARMAVEFLA